MKNRSVLITRHGGPDVLHLVESPMPQPAAGEVRVQVHAAGVSFADALMRAGAYPRWRYVPAVPFVPGWDVIGEVDACGVGAPAALLGKRVVALPKVGGYTEAICVPADRTVPVPDGVDDAEAVSLVLNYLTAHQMLHRVAAVRPGQRVLVNGAAGGVGSAVVELARLAGVEAFGTASAAKHAFVRQLGATPIDYRTQDVAATIRRAVGGGVDAAFDGIGGWHVLSSLRATRRGGKVVPFGVTAFVSRGERRPLGRPLGYLGFAVAAAAGVLQGKSVQTYSIAHSHDAHPGRFRQDLSTLLQLLQQGSIHPTVAARLPLARAAEAHALLGAAEVRGRIVLVCDGPQKQAR